LGKGGGREGEGGAGGSFSVKEGGRLAMGKRRRREGVGVGELRGGVSKEWVGREVNGRKSTEGRNG